MRISLQREKEETLGELWYSRDVIYFLRGRMLNLSYVTDNGSRNNRYVGRSDAGL